MSWEDQFWLTVKDRQEGARAEAARPVIAVEVEGVKVVRSGFILKVKAPGIADRLDVSKRS